MNNNLIINGAACKVTSRDRVFYSNGWAVNSTDPENHSLKISKDKIEIKPCIKKD